MNLAELRALAASVGFPDPDLAAAVAMAESGGNPNAYGDAQYGGSIGLWQINLPSHPGVTAAQLYDPTFNAQTAYQISNGGTNWKPWTTFDGTPVLVPGGFNTQPEPNGDILMHPDGDRSVPPSGRMP